MNHIGSTLASEAAALRTPPAEMAVAPQALAWGSAAPACPPFANRGGEHLTFVRVSESVDWATMSVGPVAAKALVGWSELEEDGNAIRGFRRSELRKCLGGKVWRRYDPHQSSKRWGLDYESWESSGDGSGMVADFLRGQECKPTRIDVAFDFSCDESVTSDRVLEMFRSRAEEVGFSIGVTGQDGVNTRYIGSIKSERRIRIYRKDLQDEVVSEFFGPIMRIELILKGDYAERWWASWSESTVAGFDVASGVVADMTGYSMRDTNAELVEMVKPEGSDPASSVSALLNQYGILIAACERAGIPLFDLAYERAESAGISAQRRGRRFVDDVREIGAKQVTSLVRRKAI